MKTLRKNAVIALLTLSSIILLGEIVMLVCFLNGDIPDPAKLPIAYSEVSVVDSKGNNIENAHYAKINEISPHIRNAFIALEDKRFYRHNGIDPIRIASAAINDIKSGRYAQGGSTITCQLAKNTYFNGEKTIRRKIKETRIAIGLEKRYTKDEILEMYLNELYFGKGIYGIRDACKRLYDKSPSEVSPLEAASLAATVANPARYSALIRYDNNSSRTKMVLRLMRDQGYLSVEEYQAEMKRDLVINKSDFHNNSADYYNNLALLEYKSLLASGECTHTTAPITLQTYLDSDLLSHASSTLLGYNDSDNSPNAEVVIANNEGGIICLATNQKIRSSKRQPGSLIKPFIYASAIESGIILPESHFFDEPKTFDGYSPSNYKKVYYGWVTAKEALSKSINTTSVEILQKQGVDRAHSTIEKCGIPLCDRDKTYSLALGGTTYGSTILDMLNGYLTLANYGATKPAHFIKSVTDNAGKVLYREKSRSVRALSKDSAYLTTDMLLDTATSGTAKQLSYLNYPIAAKTGTVAKGNGNSDAWCACYTTEHTFVCRFSGEELPNSYTGGNQPTKALRSCLRTLYSDHTPRAFPIPTTLKKVEINKPLLDALHLLVPVSRGAFGDTKSIYVTKTYIFDTFDGEKYFLKDLSYTHSESNALLSFEKVPNITYTVKANGKECEESPSGYLIRAGRFPLIGLEIICQREDKTLYRYTRILRIGKNSARIRRF